MTLTKKALLKPIYIEKRNIIRQKLVKENADKILLIFM